MAGPKVNRGPKPSKPWPEFPLYAHAAGVWAKRIRGKVHYFGPWSDPDQALDRYLHDRDHLHAGQVPPPEQDGVTLDELVNRFLEAQLTKLDIGEISRRQYLDYRRDGKRLLEALGRTRPVLSLRPGDFTTLRAAISAGRNATTIANIVVRMRTILRWAHTTRLLDRRIDYGGEFSLPSARARRKARNASGSKMFDPPELQRMLDETARHPKLRAMILLGVNAALGNTDCSELRDGHLDLASAMLDYPRPKTETTRRAALWPETVEALQLVLDRRQRMKGVPKALTDRVFITACRRVYVRIGPGDAPIDSIGLQFRNLMVRIGLHRRGRGFYALRHTFRTVADETKDFPAVDLVMGHTPTDAPGAPFSVAMADRYRERISNERLLAVADYVRRWAFGNSEVEE